VVDWGPLPAEAAEVVRRTAAARARRPHDPRLARPEEVDEIRIVAAWTAVHEPAELVLDDGLDAERISRFLSDEANG
jgi:hypothetical protein